MILDEYANINVTNRYLKYYRDLGYDVNSGDTIKVKIHDLSSSSHYMVKVKCDYCGNITTKQYRRANKEKYCCSKCRCSSKETIKEKYGVDNVFQSEEIKEKIKITSKKKYGTEHTNQSKKIKEKTKKSIQKKYGVDNVFQLDNIKEKSKKTLINKYGVDHIMKLDEIKDKIKNTNKNRYGVEHPMKNEKIKKISTKNREKYIINFIMKSFKNDGIISINLKDKIYTLKCDCGKNHIYNIPNSILSNRKKLKSILCTICNPINSPSSGMEIQLKNFIKENYYGNIKENDRSLGKELDIYLPELKLAFEFNGLYWHNELNKPKNYHLEKTELCLDKGIQLIHVWEDDWLFKQDIVKSMILNKLGKSKKIYARKCIVKEVSDNKLVKEFLNKNHIQGFIGSNIKIGLFYEGELVSLMVFGKKRKIMNSSSGDGDYELLRFCNKIGYNVVGGASKIFKYFLDNYLINEIVTYADRSYSNGNLYKQLGFEFIGKTEPNYYYIIDKKRYHRFGFRKDKLVKEGFDKDKTEHEIMLERGYFRIYNAGNFKFIFKLKNIK